MVMARVALLGAAITGALATADRLREPGGKSESGRDRSGETASAPMALQTGTRPGFCFETDPGLLLDLPVAGRIRNCSMLRISAILTILLVVFSNAIAHAGGGSPEAGADMSGVGPHHAMHSGVTAPPDHDSNAPAPHDKHDEHGTACVFGHCASACGLLVPTLASGGCAGHGVFRYGLSERKFAGVSPASDPPPPKA